MTAQKAVQKDDKVSALVDAEQEDKHNRPIRIRFSRADGLTHPLKFRRRKKIDGKVYDWVTPKDGLVNGKEYTLPKFIVDHLADLSVPIYGEVPIPGSPRETMTQVTGKKQRFNVQILDY